MQANATVNRHWLTAGFVRLQPARYLARLAAHHFHSEALFMAKVREGNVPVLLGADVQVGQQGVIHV